MNKQPSVMWGVIAFLLDFASIITIGLVVGVDYEEIGDSVENLTAGVIIPVGVGAAIVTVLVTAFGWWGPVLRDRARSRATWIILLPVVTMAISVYNVTTVDFGAVEVSYLLVLVVAALLVGFGEELTTRGALLVAARGSMGEVGVFFVTTGIFAVMHSANFFFGQDAATTLQQVGLTLIYGAGYYVMRRVTGSLIPAILMHAFWDFSLLLSAKAGDVDPTIPTLGMLVIYVLTIPCVVWAIKGANERLGAAHEAAATPA